MRTKRTWKPVFCHRWKSCLTEWSWSSHLNVMYHVQLVPVPPGLARRVRGSAIISEVCCLPWKTLQDGVYKNILNHYRAHRVWVWVVPRNQSVAAKPLDQILIQKIRFGKKNIHFKPKLIKFDPKPPQQRNRDEGRFKTLSESLQNCLPSCSFFLFHDIKLNCSEVPTLQENEEQQESVAFTDVNDIATNRLSVLFLPFLEKWLLPKKS